MLWILRKELVTEDTDMHVATSAVLAMVSLTESTCCPLNVVSEYVDIIFCPNARHQRQVIMSLARCTQGPGHLAQLLHLKACSQLGAGGRFESSNPVKADLEGM